MNIKIENNELLSLMHVEIDTDKLAELLRKKMGYELSKAICDNTRSYIDSEKLLSPECTITIRDNENIVVTLKENNKDKEFIIYNTPLLYLLLSIYYLNNISRSIEIDNSMRVEYGEGWIDEEEKEKEAE